MRKHDLDLSFSVSDDDIREFAAIWKIVFGEELPHKEAQTIAGRLLALYSVLAKPPPESPARVDQA